MSKKAVIEVIENAKIRKNEYFVKGYDITESIEVLLEEVKKDYEFKKQVELQCGLHTRNDFLNIQAEKYGKQINELKHQLSLTEKALELACKELRDYSCMQCNNCNKVEMCDYVLSLYPLNYFIEEAKEIMKSE